MGDGCVVVIMVDGRWLCGGDDDGWKVVVWW